MQNGSYPKVYRQDFGITAIKRYAHNLLPNLKGGSHIMRRGALTSAVIFFMLFGTIPAMAAGVHNVQRGDSLYKIAKNNGVTVQEIKNANGIKSDTIHTGDKVAVPDSQNSGGQNQSAPSQNAGAADYQRNVDLLARLICAEASGEPFKGQVAVGAVIMNRTNDPKFPATIAGNIFKHGEFESVSNQLIWYRTPDSTAYQAARAAISGWDPTNGAKFFYNPAKVFSPYSYVWTRTVIDRIGNHVFAI